MLIVRLLNTVSLPLTGRAKENARSTVVFKKDAYGSLLNEVDRPLASVSDENEVLIWPFLLHFLSARPFSEVKRSNHFFLSSSDGWQ